VASKNDVCGIGIAYNAKIAGLRILSGHISPIDEAIALNYHYNTTDIYSCSWGPHDDGATLGDVRDISRKAFLNGVNNGRAGKGSIFVFSSGNGGGADDMCGFDGYNNAIWTVTIGSVNDAGWAPVYSEGCSAMMGVTYSSGSRRHRDIVSVSVFGGSLVPK
jgi:kexin